MKIGTIWQEIIQGRLETLFHRRIKYGNKARSEGFNYTALSLDGIDHSFGVVV
jgi:hypothetical protein